MNTAPVRPAVPSRLIGLIRQAWAEFVDVQPGGITISAEKHRGRVMVRVEVPAGKR